MTEHKDRFKCPIGTSTDSAWAKGICRLQFASQIKIRLVGFCTGRKTEEAGGKILGGEKEKNLSLMCGWEDWGEPRPQRCEAIVVDSARLPHPLQGRQLVDWRYQFCFYSLFMAFMSHRPLEIL